MEEPTYCDHCGNRTYRAVRGSYETEPDETGTFASFVLYECTICRLPVLEEVSCQLREDSQGSRQPRFRAEDAESARITQLWPPAAALPPEVPDRVREIYQEARAVMRRSPSSFVVQVGRALEALTRDKGSQGRTLGERLNWLIEQGHLPPVLGEMAHINRVFRNWGAHDAEVDVGPDDAEIADEFFGAIIEYLYIAPARVSRVQSLLNQRPSAP